MRRATRGNTMHRIALNELIGFLELARKNELFPSDTQRNYEVAMVGLRRIYTRRNSAVPTERAELAKLMMRNRAAHGWALHTAMEYARRIAHLVDCLLEYRKLGTVCLRRNRPVHDTRPQAIIRHRFPLREDFDVVMWLPRDLTMQEANKLERWLFKLPIPPSKRGVAR